MIDITDLLSRNEDKNFLDLFIRNENNIILDLYSGFAYFYKQHPEKFYYYFKQLADDFQYYFVDMQPYTPKKSDFPLYEKGEYINRLIYEYVNDSRELIDEIKRRYGLIELIVLEYTLKLQSFLKHILDFEATVWLINCIPNFIYNRYYPLKGDEISKVYLYIRHIFLLMKVHIKRISFHNKGYGLML